MKMTLSLVWVLVWGSQICSVRESDFQKCGPGGRIMGRKTHSLCFSLPWGALTLHWMLSQLPEDDGPPPPPPLTFSEAVATFLDRDLWWTAIHNTARWRELFVWRVVTVEPLRGHVWLVMCRTAQRPSLPGLHTSKSALMNAGRTLHSFYKVKAR